MFKRKSNPLTEVGRDTLWLGFPAASTCKNIRLFYLIHLAVSSPCLNAKATLWQRSVETHCDLVFKNMFSPRAIQPAVLGTKNIRKLIINISKVRW